MFASASGIVINGGTFNSQTIRMSRGMDILMERVATGAFHNSDELYDAPKCHPHTRVAVLDDIMRWVESARDDFMLWLFGPAGAGKTAIVKKIADIATDQGLLIATFFFSSTTQAQSSKDRLIATLAYQLALSIPDTRAYIEDAIEQDPAIFNKNIQTQVDTLLIKPFQSVSSTQIIPSQKLIIIDGLDECNDSQAQVAILDAISLSFHNHNLPIIFLIASRPEQRLVIAFNTGEPLKSIHRRLALDAKYRPNSDIHLFLSDKFEHIKHTHPLRASIPSSWPTPDSLNTLVYKSSGQFIYAATVIRFVESIRHRPTMRLDIVLGISPPSSENPFAQLDALYHRILSCVTNISLTLRVLSVYIADPPISAYLDTSDIEQLLSLDQGDIELAMVDLPSIVSCETGVVTTSHASLADFLLDRRRSTIFYIDMAVRNSDLAHCMFRSYDLGANFVPRRRLFWPRTFRWLGQLCQHASMNPELRNDFTSFDLEAFVRNAIEAGDIEKKEIIHFAYDWVEIICNASLEDRDKQDTLDRCNIYLKLKLQPYQSDCRLQLLVTLVVFFRKVKSHFPNWQSGLTCRMKDILLELDEHSLHLVDQNALDLRHTVWPMRDDFEPPSGVFCEFRVNGKGCSSLALKCFRFLADPSKYLESRHILDSGTEWSSIVFSYCILLYFLLLDADPIPELLQFVANHDVHPVIKRKMPALLLWNMGLHTLAFLSRANVCVNWRIVLAIQSTPYAFPGSNYWQLLGDVTTCWSSGTCSGNDPCCPEEDLDSEEEL